MMRFRVCDGKKMHYPEDGAWLIDQEGIICCLHDSIDGCHLDRFDEEDDFSVMLSTGLYDKNGGEIFDADILFCSWGALYCQKWLVVWHNSQLALQWINHEGEMIDFYIPCEQLNHTIQNTEIIGNRYENPELLKAVVS